jgi:hypothetical protein
MTTFILLFILLGGGGFVYQIFDQIHEQAMKKLELRERQLKIDEEKVKLMSKLGPRYLEIESKVYDRLINSDLEDYTPNTQVEKDILKELENR